MLLSCSWHQPTPCQQPSILADLGGAWPHASQQYTQEADGKKALMLLDAILQAGRAANSNYLSECTPKSSILFRGMVWYSEGAASGGL